MCWTKAQEQSSLWMVGGKSLVYMDGLGQDCVNSIAKALELLQSCTKPLMLSIYMLHCFQEKYQDKGDEYEIYFDMQFIYSFTLKWYNMNGSVLSGNKQLP